MSAPQQSVAAPLASGTPVAEAPSGPAVPAGAAVPTGAVAPTDVMSRTAAALRTALRAVGRGAGHLHWYLKEIMGENAYVHYLESYRRRHGTEEGALTSSEFWKDLTDEQDRNPKARCC